MSAWESAESRKQRLAAAVWRVIVRGGIGAVSVRSVAAEAEMAVGSLRNLYPSRAELMADAALRIFSGVRDRVTAMPRTGNPAVDGVRMLEALVPLDAQRRIEFEVNLALMAEARSNDSVRAARDRAHRDIRSACTALVRALGVSAEDAHGSARRLHALVDGIALQLLHQQPDDDVSWASAELARAVDEVAGAGRGA